MANSLRLFQYGKLNTSAGNLLPTVVVNWTTQFLAGDIRVNENSALTITQTIIMREHNRVCDEVYALNS